METDPATALETNYIEIGFDEVTPFLGIEQRRNAGRIHPIAKHHCDGPALAGGPPGRGIIP